MAGFDDFEDIEQSPLKFEIPANTSRQPLFEIQQI